MSTSLQHITIDGKTVLVEVAGLASAASAAPLGNERFSHPPPVSTAPHEVDIAQTLQTVVAPVFRSLQAMAPDEANLELMLGFGVKGDVFVAKGEANASLRVTAKWKFEGNA